MISHYCAAKSSISLRTVNVLISLFALSSLPATYCQSQGNPFDLLQLSSLPEKDAKHVPFRYDSLLAPFIIIQARINGSEPLPLIVDTGVTVPLVLFSWAADKLNIRATQDPSRPGASGSSVLEGPRIPLDIVTARGLPIRVDNVPSYIAPGADLSAVCNVRVAAMIGLPLLRKWTVRLDFEARDMSIFPVVHGPYKPLGSVCLPLIMSERLAEALVPFSTGNQARLMVDTGANTTIVPYSVVRPLPIAARKVVAISDVFGKVDITQFVLTKEVQIGAFREADVPIVVSPSKEMPKLGTDIMGRFRVVLDFRNRLLTLERSKEPPDPQPAKGSTGIVLQASTDKYLVGEVETGSPAAEAGVTKGLRVIEVDGAPLAGLGSVSAKSLLDGFAGTTCKLTLEDSKGARLSKSFRRERWFSNTPSAVEGFTIRWSSGAAYEVGDVWEDSAAYKKGLRPGDLVTRVNELDLGKADFQDVLRELSMPKLRLRIKRPGVDPMGIDLDATEKP